jgi:rRNA biogenesis protein RRP5
LYFYTNQHLYSIFLSARHLVGEYRHGLYIQCRVLGSSGTSKGTVEVSLRQSRLDGDLDKDEPPEHKEIVHAYVVSTTKKGCFLRLSRFVEGRTILKELSDSFLPDPTTMFPPGRLIVGKVKEVPKVSNKKGKKKVMVDLDMRESVLLDDQNKLTFEDIKMGDKHNGIVTRIESYGVFVRIENSKVSGLVHLSECSDDYVKNLASMFNLGDLVKILVIKVETEGNRLGFSMKPSHFEDDDSDDDTDMESSSDSDSETDDVVMKDVDDADLDSDDDDFVSKLANKIKDKKEKSNDNDSDSSDEESDDDDDDDDDKSESSSDESDDEKPQTMDTDVGFDWGTNASAKTEEEDSDSSDDSDSDDENATSKGHKSRKKTIAKREEEKAITKAEQRIADGTADENPETTADFERLIASDPNSSEHWIKFMAYHLSLADIESARSIANRAFDRIEFRKENEKMNVWSALIMLESKYGTPNSLTTTIDRASQHNNPKQVYLRVCEMMEREVEQSHGDASTIEKADEMFAKMCKKFKSKKTVWIAHFKYLLKNGRHEEAHKLWKRSVMSLPSHKHIESMSKFAQLEYEYGSAERARTIFDALLDKHPKRMDLIFVYVDKEIKHGDLSAARRTFEKIVNPTDHGQKKAKFNDKQMKSLFKKWYRMEDDHGDEESRMHVKVTAKEYVEKSTK